MAIDICILAALTTGAYMLGSIPFGLVLSKIFYSTDLRAVGSGNIGATNARRVGGWPLGLATLLLDMAKGAIPVVIGILLFGKNGLAAHAVLCLSALGAFWGHLYPLYLGFRTGGKGVATAGGAFLVLSPVAFLSALAMFLAAAALSRRVSVGSLAAAATLPAAVFFIEKNLIYAAAGLIILAFIIVGHRENIIRLANNTEPRI